MLQAKQLSYHEINESITIKMDKIIKQEHSVYQHH